jgi:AcrR family transcriptional regulator
MADVAVSRRIGAEGSSTRLQLVDAAEALLLEEGYAAVTSRRVAAKAGLKPQLVHYYFRTMDDLFLEVYRRRAAQSIERFTRAMDVHRSLRTMWRFGADLGGAAFNVEFAALGNHRKAIRDEIGHWARRYRELQLDAVTAILGDLGISPEVCPPVVVLLALTGVTQVMAIEEALGVTDGHRETLAFVDAWIDRTEHLPSPGPPPAQP